MGRCRRAVTHSFCLAVPFHLLSAVVILASLGSSAVDLRHAQVGRIQGNRGGVRNNSVRTRAYGSSPLPKRARGVRGMG